MPDGSKMVSGIKVEMNEAAGKTRAGKMKADRAKAVIPDAMSQHVLKTPVDVANRRTRSRSAGLASHFANGMTKDVLKAKTTGVKEVTNVAIPAKVRNIASAMNVGDLKVIDIKMRIATKAPVAAPMMIRVMF